MTPARLLILGLVLTGALLAVAQKPQEQVFRDKSGKLKLWNMESHEVNFQTKGPLKFEGTGKPVMGKSDSQGVTLESRKVVALLIPGQKDSYLLKSADLDGAVKLSQSVTTPEGTAKRDLASESVSILDETTEATITLKAPFTFVQTETARSSRASGSSGVIKTDSLQNPKSALRSGSITGNGEFSVKESSRDVTLKSAKVNFAYEGSNVRFTLPSSFTTAGNQTLPTGGSRVLNLSAGQGDVLLEEKAAKGTDAFVSLDLKGGVTIVIIETKTVETKNGPKKEVRTINAKSPTLTYSRTTRQMVLAGGVAYSVESKTEGEETLGGEGNSEQLVLTLNEKGEVTDYRAKSGSTTLRQGDKP